MRSSARAHARPLHTTHALAHHTHHAQRRSKSCFGDAAATSARCTPTTARRPKRAASGSSGASCCSPRTACCSASRGALDHRRCATVPLCVLTTPSLLRSAKLGSPLALTLDAHWRELKSLAASGAANEIELTTANGSVSTVLHCTAPVRSQSRRPVPKSAWRIRAPTGSCRKCARRTRRRLAARRPNRLSCACRAIAKRRSKHRCAAGHTHLIESATPTTTLTAELDYAGACGLRRIWQCVCGAGRAARAPRAWRSAVGL